MSAVRWSPVTLHLNQRASLPHHWEKRERMGIGLRGLAIWLSLKGMSSVSGDSDNSESQRALGEISSIPFESRLLSLLPHSNFIFMSLVCEPVWSSVSPETQSACQDSSTQDSRAQQTLLPPSLSNPLSLTHSLTPPLSLSL